MYSPSHFAESRIDVLHALIDAHPLGAIVTQRADGLHADHVPFEIAAPTPEAPHGILRAHIARANSLREQDGAQAMAIFQGPSAYISPSWYEEKAVSGKVVPTYNYAVVHAHGPLRVIDDPVWLLALLSRLTARHEGRRAAPWQVADAPPAFIERLLRAIVGIEIPIARIKGKWKQSQDHPSQDLRTIAAGLSADSATAAAAAMMPLARADDS